MSANLASGGRVWSFDKTATSVITPSKPKFLARWGLALWYGLPASILISLPGILFLLNGAETVYEKAESIAGGWGQGSTSPAWPTILFTFGTTIPLMFLLIFVLERVVVYKRSLAATILLMIVPVILSSALVITSNNQANMGKETFKEWAQSTYGYTITNVGKEEGSTVVYEATDKDGRAIKVQSFVKDKNTYLYETLPQLNDIITRIIAEKEGK